MIYTSFARAQEVADMLNERKGYAFTYVIHTDHGWSLSCTTSNYCKGRVFQEDGKPLMFL